VKEVVQRGDAAQQTITFVTGVHPLGQQEAAELLLAQLGILDFHPVGSHAERIVLQISFTRLTTKIKKLIQ